MTDKILKTNMITPEGVMQWVFLDKPKTDKNHPDKDPQYTVTFLMDKNDPTTKESLIKFNNCVNDALVKKFGDKVPAKFTNPLKDGDKDTDSEGNPCAPKYPNNWYFEAKAKSNSKPGVALLGDNKELIPVTEEGKVWSGCKGKLSINLWAWDVKPKKGVSAGLNNVLVTDTSAPKMSGKRDVLSDFENEV
jgi:hypothetical protein